MPIATAKVALARLKIQCASLKYPLAFRLKSESLNLSDVLQEMMNIATSFCHSGKE